MTRETRRLSEREAQVLNGAARGELARETAERLGISQETVRRVRSQVMRKLDAKTTAHAVAKACGWRGV